MAIHWTEFPERVELFGDLIDILETLDRDYAGDVLTFESFSNESDQSAYTVTPNGPVYHFDPRSARMPGLERLLTRIESEGHSGLTLAVLRHFRGRACTVLNTDRATVNALTITQVADTLDTAERPPAANVASTGVPAPTPTVQPPSSYDAPPPQETEGATSPVGRRYTLGRLIQVLDGIEQNREFNKAHLQEQLRRDPVRGAMNAVYAAAMRWRPDENEFPGIGRIELLCDLESGDAGINAVKVRRLRARICQQQHWEPQHADRLDLTEAADILEGVQRVSLGQFQQAAQSSLHIGHATLDTIHFGGESIGVTGLSCKVIAGTTPTVCPVARPALPPALLPLADKAIRRLNHLPPGTTIHWVGHDTGYRSRCTCHPNAPFAAPFDQPRWASVDTTAAATPKPGNSSRASDVVGGGTEGGCCERCRRPAKSSHRTTS